MAVNNPRKTLLISLTFVSTLCYSQKNRLCPSTESKKAEKYLEQAKEARQDKKAFSVIYSLCEKSLSEDSAYVDTWKLMGDAAWQSHKDSIMAVAYEKAIGICPDISADIHYRLANYLFDTKQFEKSVVYFQSFLDFEKVKEENARDAEKKIASAKFMMKPVAFNPIPLEGVCGPDPEYLAIISPDQDYCFFTRRFEEQKRGALFPVSVEKFMISKKSDGNFDKGEPMNPPFNKAGSNNEGGASITIDNKHLFFTVNKNGNFDIYTSDESKGEWSEPRSVGTGINHPERWESQPCISPDGKTLYFVSIRDSIHQSSDIFISKKQPDGTWGKAVNAGGVINTTGNEKTPFIHPDNKTFYFSSDLHSGLGGYDIFMCKIQSDGSFSKPVNIGYPINTEADELGFFVSTDGKNGYFASNNLKGKGAYDIYSFDLPDNVKPERVLFIKGEIKEDENMPNGATSIQLKNTNTQELAEIAFDSLSGKYASVVSFDSDYILTVKKKGAAYNSAYFSVKDSTVDAPRKVDFTLKPTEVGAAYTLNDILFDSESSVLTVQSKTIILDFSEYLKENPGMKLELHGHTDSSGSPEKNQKLSEERARAVYQFLIENGIQAGRLSFKGFGSGKPVADNNTEQGKYRNRRTEFFIVSQ